MLFAQQVVVDSLLDFPGALLCVSNDEKSSTDFAYLHGFLMIPVLVSDGWWST